VQWFNRTERFRFGTVKQILGNFHMNKQMFKGVIAASVAAAAIFGATSAQAAPATAAAKAEILAAVTIAKTSDLDFGTIAAGAASGTVTVSTAGVRSGCAAGSGLVCSGAVTAAGFNLTGAANTVVSQITMPASVSLIGPAGSTAMAATLTSNVGTGVTLSATGAGTLKVGGTLTVGAAQAAGSYTVNFNVDAAYN
jgi:Mat/Ecp fimbriae major subunit